MMRNLFILFIFNLSLFSSDDYNATKNAQDLGLYYQDYNFLMGLSGLLLGFIFTIIILLLIIQISKK